MKDRCVAALGETGAVCRKPMGPLFEDVNVMVLEALVPEIRDRLGAAPEAMRARHTSLG